MILNLGYYKHIARLLVTDYSVETPCFVDFDFKVIDEKRKIIAKGYRLVKGRKIKPFKSFIGFGQHIDDLEIDISPNQDFKGRSIRLGHSIPDHIKIVRSDANKKTSVR